MYSATREDALKVAAGLWDCTDVDEIKGEYLRGQVELIAYLFGWDDTEDSDVPRDEIRAEIIRAGKRTPLDGVIETLNRAIRRDNFGEVQSALDALTALRDTI